MSQAWAGPVSDVGIDLLEIDRLERALERTPRLAERLFTEGRARVRRHAGRPGQHLAARFCAKEAVAKALGIESWNFHEVEVLGTGGPPRIRLSGAPRPGPPSSACRSRCR